MRIAVALYLVLHGFCHLVGFVVPWKIATLKEEPYKTTLLAGAIDVRDSGIRVIGVLWLATAVAFFAAAAGVVAPWEWWRPFTLYLAVFSLVLCLLGLPGARIGIAANAVLLAYLALGDKIGWLPVVK